MALRNPTFHSGIVSCACNLHFRTVKSIRKRVQLHLGQCLLRWVILVDVHSKSASVPSNSFLSDQGKTALLPSKKIGAIVAVQVDAGEFDHL